MIEIEDAAKKELKKIDKQDAKRIIKFLRERVAPLDNPRNLGSPLKGSKLGEFWRYRVGDYRIVSAIEDEALRILVVRVGHRGRIYKS